MRTGTAAIGLMAMCIAATGVVRADEDRPVSHGRGRPNIVLIMCDDMGFSDIGCYGGEIETPNLDKLASRGVRFREFYNNGKCEHTRASLLTGRWWHHVGASPKVHYGAPTFGERLRELGYRTLMVGKWHAGQTPHQRGFDRHYGLTDGCCNYWNPGDARPGEPAPARKTVRRWAIDDKEFKPYTPTATDFYTTDAFTDAALGYLDQYKGEDKPFVLYVAYTAPHYPLHASEQDVAKYRGRYAAIGWDRLREQRFARQRELGVMPPNAKLSPRDPGAPAWADLPEPERDGWDLRMATYAAMIDRMDRNIGRLLAKLDEIGEADNTVIFFLSDNGACDESGERSTVKGSMPWEVTSYLTQGKPWANASNTPFRDFKATCYEGGVRTPMIAVWPGVAKPGTFTDMPGHLVDFTPTMLELAGADASQAADLSGVSLTSAMRGQRNERASPLYWQYGRSAAMREGGWKMVRAGQETWRLYNLTLDPTESTDLADAEPQRLKGMAEAWEKWWKSGQGDADK